jgi:tRNA nucleotidyltransferase (CCA-adding enzyme)
MAPDIFSVLSKYLPADCYAFLLKASETADKRSTGLYLVGGIVRDLFLKRPNLDLDIVAEEDAPRLAKELAGEFKVKATFHTRFMTSKLPFPDFSVDIAAARKETYKHSGALPEVKPGTMSDDLARRDFTINAMALRLNSPEPGKLLDPFSGRKDLDNKYIRVLYKSSFVDDATRIFRAIRYEQRLQFHIEPDTLALLKHDPDVIGTVGPDRIKHEIVLALNEEKPERFVRRAHELGVLRKVHPGLSWNLRLDGLFVKARETSKPGQLPLIYLCLMIYNFSNAELEGFIKRYNLTKKQVDSVTETIALNKESEKLNRTDIDPYGIYSILSKYSSIPLQVNLIASELETAKLNIRSYLSKFRFVRTSLSGNDLISLGVPAGPEIGKTLSLLQKAKLNNRLKSQDEEREFVKKIRESGKANPHTGHDPVSG